MAEEEEVETGEETEVEPKETEGETSETPHVCPQCGREFGSKQALSSHVGKAHKEEEEQKEGVGEEGIKPPEIARREQIIEDLREKLPKIYGISDNRADAIVDGIEDNPSILDNPRSLWYHIMEMCRGTNINTYQLNNALKGHIRGERRPPKVSNRLLSASKVPKLRGRVSSHHKRLTALTHPHLHINLR